MSNPVKPSEDTVLWAKAERVADDNTMNHLHPIPTAPLGEESYVTAMSNAETPLISSTTTTTTLIVNQSLGRYVNLVHDVRWRAIFSCGKHLSYHLPTS